MKVCTIFLYCEFSKIPSSEEVAVSYALLIINNGKQVSKEESLSLEKDYKK